MVAATGSSLDRGPNRSSTTMRETQKTAGTYWAPPHDTPTAADTHSAAAVVSPWTTCEASSVSASLSSLLLRQQ
jgi:hypothetical protein